MKLSVATLVVGVAGLFAQSASDQSERRVSLVLLSDISYSARPAPLDQHTDPIRAAIATLVPNPRAGARAAVGLVTNKVLLSSFDTDARSLWREWNRLAGTVTALDRYGPSPLWDAMDAGVSALAPEPGTRAVILWTDGRPTGNVLSAVELSQRAARANVRLYVLINPEEPLTDTQGNRVTFRPCAVFEPVTGATGGSCAIRSQKEAPAAAIGRIVAELEARSRKD